MYNVWSLQTIFEERFMPFYEYQCQACDKITEALQKMSDPPLTDCPDCGQAALSKLISKTSFQLKGSGWYVTDFRGDKKPTDSDKEGTSSAESTSDSVNDTTNTTDTTTSTSASTTQKTDASASTPSNNKATSKPKSNSEAA